MHDKGRDGGGAWCTCSDVTPKVDEGRGGGHLVVHPAQVMVLLHPPLLFALWCGNKIDKEIIGKIKVRLYNWILMSMAWRERERERENEGERQMRES